jgi:hypothetical protein
LTLTRRAFLETGGLVIAFALIPRVAGTQERLPGSLNGNRRLDA